MSIIHPKNDNDFIFNHFCNFQVLSLFFLYLTFKLYIVYNIWDYLWTVKYLSIIPHIQYFRLKLLESDGKAEGCPARA